MARYIYGRVSTEGQTVDAQAFELIKKYPDAQLVSEIASGAKKRPILEALIAQLQPGDELIVFGLDRLGRRTTDVLNLLDVLEKRGVNFVSQREGVDFRTPVGKLVLSILAAVAAMEREMLVERTKAGLKAAKAKGRIGGRRSSIPQLTIDSAMEMVASGVSIRKAAKKYGVSHTRLRNEQKKRASAQNN